MLRDGSENFLISVFFFIVFIFSCHAYSLPNADDHTKFACLVVFGDIPLDENFKAIILKLNSRIDNADNLMGMPFHDAVTGKFSNSLRDRCKGITFTSFDHRYFYHWGYNAANIEENPTPTTENLHIKIDELIDKVNKQVLKNTGHGFSSTESTEIKRTIIDVINEKKIERAREIKSEMDKLDLVPNRSTPLAVILYEMHILSDFVSAAYKSSDSAQRLRQIEPLGDLNYHVKKELIDGGLREMRFDSLAKKIQSKYYDESDTGLDILWNRQPLEFKKLLRIENPSNTLLPVQKRALIVLCYLREELPELMKKLINGRVKTENKGFLGIF